MMDPLSVILLVIIPFILLTILYSLGKVARRETGREPFASGHAFPSTYIPYKPRWLYYIALFILWDIIVIFILFMASEMSLYVITSLLILIATMLAYPIRISKG
ncbi:MAG: hypothetical protein NDP24_05950 [Crenarchaeota archaeon]|nr:hypothetical protein [Thermoproteota archaeon]MCR8471186.1 hypothetical protein [Thermoproteota archaeon]MCR8472340.1 hypothetical protein [Thermoproteota archaeon]MCR8473672.1 hypothetical protein [Thermoproteota archaeon]MCR8489039.1 hypothetical protein [Thermoproteota archaeon]